MLVDQTNCFFTSEMNRECDHEKYLIKNKLNFYFRITLSTKFSILGLSLTRQKFKN